MATVGDMRKMLEGKADEQLVEIQLLQANIVVHELPKAENASEPTVEAEAKVE